MSTVFGWDTDTGWDTGAGWAGDSPLPPEPEPEPVDPTPDPGPELPPAAEHTLVSAYLEENGERLRLFPPEQGAAGDLWDLNAADLGFPEVREDVEDRPDLSGTDDSTMLHGGKAVTLELTLYGDAHQPVPVLADRLRAWMHPARRPRLVYRLGGQPERWMRLRGSRYADPLTAEGYPTAEVQLAWRNPDGVAFDVERRVALVNPAEPETGRVYPRAGWRIYPAGGGLGEVDVQGLGNTPSSELTISVFGPCEGPAITATVNGRSRTLELAGLTLTAGEWLLITPAARRVQLNGQPGQGASRRRFLSVRQWWLLEPGLTTVRFHPAEHGTGCRAELSWHPASI